MSALRLRASELSWREVDGEVIAIDAIRSMYLSTNPAGAMLWQMLSEGATQETLASRLVETFGITPERAQRDVVAFLDSLAARDLLER